MQAQLIPGALCEEGVAAFTDLLKGRASGTLNDDYFARDWSPLWDELVRDGWTVIADPPDTEFSLLDLTAFAQAWGRYLVPLPFVPTLVARRALAAASASAGTAFPGDLAPSTRLSYAVAEGTATVLAPLGHAADQVLTGDGLTAVSGADRTDGQGAGGQDMGAWGADAWASSAPIALLPGGTSPASAATVIEGAILATAEAAGAAAAALDAAVEYAKVREQFGQPIGKFQALKHRMANMHCSRELAASALAWACSEPENAGRALRAALGECLLVVEQSVQVHGGIGFTWEAAPHRYYRHVMAMRRLVLAAVGEE
jgi:Acyl-CoA dehydrogenase, C-terminal domain